MFFPPAYLIAGVFLKPSTFGRIKLGNRVRTSVLEAPHQRRRGRQHVLDLAPFGPVIGIKQSLRSGSHAPDPPCKVESRLHLELPRERLDIDQITAQR